MREQLVLFLLCQSLVTSLRHFKDYERIGCYETITEEQGIILPTGKYCDIYISSQHGRRTVLDFFWDSEDISCEENPNAIQIVYANGVRSVCNAEGAFLESSLGSLIVRVDNLPIDVKLHITYVRPVFVCSDTVPHYEMLGVPFIFESNKEDYVHCPLMLPSGVNIDVQTVERLPEQCGVTVDLAQGRTKFRATQSTGKICIGHENLTTEIYCGVGRLSLFGPKETKLRILLTPPNNKQIREFFYKRSTCPI